jgi:RNA polymerase sigma factor (sigma-70 family)
MHVNDVSVVKILKRLAARLTPDASLQQDLLQEALIHLWLIETRRPRQTTSWYLQSCRFHLQHYMSSGRSVDSAKRRGGQVELENSLESEEAIEIQTDRSEDQVISEVSARDLVRLISKQLSNEERAVLNCLTEGLGPREIGRRLNITHTQAVRHRCKIAKLLARLERQYAPSDLSCNLNIEAPSDKVAPQTIPTHVFAENVMPILRAA